MYYVLQGTIKSINFAAEINDYYAQIVGLDFVNCLKFIRLWMLRT